VWPRHANAQDLGIHRSVGRVLAHRQAAVRPCYNRALHDDPKLTGRIAIDLRIAQDGKPCGARVKLNELGDSGVAECAVEMVLDRPYPPPAGGCVDVNMPWRFIPKSAGTDGGPPAR
jgi:hypothetical protein